MRPWLKRIREWKVSLGPRRVAAADFDAGRLTLVLAEQTRRGVHIRQALGVELPPSLERDNPMALGEFLGQTLRDLRFGEAQLAMCLPRSQAVLKSLTLPPGTPDDQMASMVAFQVEKDLPFRAEDAVIDFTVESHYDAAGCGDSGTQGVEVLVAAVRVATVDFYRKIAEAAGAGLDRLELRPYCNLRCLSACRDRQAGENLALVQVVAGEAEIDVICAGSLSFSRSAAVNAGAPGAVASLTAEVARSLQSYLAVARNVTLDRLAVAGQSGLETELARQLADRLGVDGKVIDLTDSLRLDRMLVNSSSFISTLGLALHDSCQAIAPFNFVDPKRPPIRRDVKKIRSMATLAGGAVLLVGLLAADWLYLDGKDKQIRSLTAESNRLKKERDRIAVLGKRVDAIDDWVDGQRPWLAHWALLSSLLPPADQAYIGVMATSASGVISFDIHVTSDQALADMRKRLEDAGYEVRTGQVQRDQGRFGYIYNAKVDVIPGPKQKIDVGSIKLASRPADDTTGPLSFSRRGEGWGRSGGRGEDARSSSPSPASTASSTTPASGTAGASPAQPAADQPSVFGWGEIRKGPDALKGLSGQSVAIKGRLSGRQRNEYVLPHASEQEYVCYELRRPGGYERFPLYFRKGSPALERWERNKENERYTGDEGVTIRGRVWYVSDRKGNRWWPAAAMIVDGIED